jgi:hypothetical protein
VRAAVAQLRDPYQRLLAELWARHAPASLETGPAEEPAPASDLRRALGWRP